MMSDAVAPKYVRQRQASSGLRHTSREVPTAIEVSAARRKIFETGQIMFLITLWRLHHTFLSTRSLYFIDVQVISVVEERRDEVSYLPFEENTFFTHCLAAMLEYFSNSSVKQLKSKYFLI